MTDVYRDGSNQINNELGPIRRRKSYWLGSKGADITDLSYKGFYPRRVHVFSAGNLDVTYADGTHEVITGITAGTVFDDCCWVSIAAATSSAYNLSFGW